MLQDDFYKNVIRKSHNVNHELATTNSDKKNIDNSYAGFLLENYNHYFSTINFKHIVSRLILLIIATCITPIITTVKCSSDINTGLKSSISNYDAKTERFYDILLENRSKYDIYFIEKDEEINRIRDDNVGIFPPVKKYIEIICEMVLKSEDKIIPFFIKNRDLILDLLVEHCPELNLKILEKILSEKKKFTIIRFSSYNR